MIYEGVETGIEHEWPVPCKANSTYVGQRIKFETDQFILPSRPGWYTVNAKISDRFDQTWIEWSFQFRVADGCRTCDVSRETYIAELKEKLHQFQQEKNNGDKFSR